MLELLIVLICASILVSALLAVLLDNLLAAVISAGLTGLFSAISYLLLAAPDVAMTEASIGAGLTTFIFLYAMRMTGSGDDRK